MENKICKKYFFLLFLLFSSCFFSQIKKINFLIMFDEKPLLKAYSVSLRSPSIGVIEADYIVGSIDLSNDYYNKIINDNSPDLDVQFEAFLPKSPLSKKYIFSLPKEFLNQKYIIVNIFNKGSKVYQKRYSKASKNSKDYYVVITSPDFSKFD